MDEAKLVKLYMDLTGSTESTARAVLMYVTADGGRPSEDALEPEAAVPLKPDRTDAGPVPRTRADAPLASNPANRLAGTAAAFLVAFALLLSSGTQAAPEASGDSRSFVTTPLSLADAVDIALRQNASVLRGKKDLEATEGIVIQTRAIVVPKVVAAGRFGAVQSTDIDTFRGPGFTFGTSENWESQIRLVQSIYEGGRMLSSLRTARLRKQQSLLNYRTVLADTALAVQLAFYDVLLAVQQILVEEASVELLAGELADTTRRFEAGTVPRFNVLRAEVELANTRPKLISARNSLRTAKNNLANILGFNVPREALEDIPLNVVGRLDDQPFPLPLPRALALARENRTELEASRKTEALRKEDVVSARSGQLPTLQGFAGYDVHNSTLSQVLTVERYGWIAGAQVSWNLFDGLRTHGRVLEATANFERAGIDVADVARRVELEVRTAFSTFSEAREVIASQKKVVEQAEEALRLAQARAAAGTSTQLDVLTAQTALTQARTTQIQALHGYDVARARLQRAAGLSFAEQEKEPAEAK
jgi:outer membrane protein